MFWMLAACTGSTPVPSDQPTDLPTPAGAETVTLTTRDGVDLVGDVYPGDPDAHGVVLLHMTPVGGWNRTDWPASFIEKLGAQGWWVLALDRRGAGDSEGVAEDAFEGPAGKYDVEAAVLELDARGAGAPVLIGASNGTTSALDYTLWAPAEGLPHTAALGFLTGGTYTENQNDLPALDLPAVFTYSTDERDWSVSKQPLANQRWTFLEYPDGAHGTQMFAAVPTFEDELVEAFATLLE